MSGPTEYCNHIFSVPLQSIDVNVSIQGFVGSVISELTYRNKGSVAVGAVFIFPLDAQSAVYQFEAEIDGKVIIAECQDKEQVPSCYYCSNLYSTTICIHAVSGSVTFLQLM